MFVDAARDLLGIPGAETLAQHSIFSVEGGQAARRQRYACAWIRYSSA
jgi:hypothetical protein